MSILVYFFAIFACVFAQGEHDHHDHEMHRVNVAVYYESLCPDSIKFFTKQLYPSLQKQNISQYVNLTLVPYGKSTMKQLDGKVAFECHHGEGECRGNKLQACALKKIDNGQNTEGMGYNKIATAFINCLMDKVVRDGNNTNFPSKVCAEMNAVPATTITDIETCQTSQGDAFLEELGKKTDMLNPKLASVPYIVFNMEQKDEDSKMANENFVKALCKYIPDPKPAECTANGAPVYKISSIVALLAVASYFY